MEMKLDLTEALLCESRETIEVLGAVLLAGKEPAVPRRPAVAVAELAELWIPVDPRFDARATYIVWRIAVEWFVGIAKREQHVPPRVRLWRARTEHEVACVIGQPLVEILFAKAG